MKRKIVILLKKIYRHIPLSLKTKQKIKNILVTKFKIIKKIQNYNDKNILPQPMGKNDLPLRNVQNIKINKKIAVHLHLYYTDLAEEFINYFNSIPYQFDLFISVAKKEVIKEVENKFKEVKQVNKVIVKASENFGRDFSPMFILFKNDLLKYDYLLHCHSKKSVRTGSEQDGWRNHMLKNLLQNENTVKQIIETFYNEKNIGLIYPETYKDMPYWAHTWLYNKGNCDKIANRLGITLEDEYIDYSVGSFFWVKVDAIRDFMNLNFTKDDFGEEAGKADGTLAHAIERMIPQAVNKKGYNYYVIDIANSCFRTTGLKNLYQYNEQNSKNVLEKLKKFDVISFDIFDTLITRKIISPGSLFNILENYVLEKYNISNFKSIRQNSEFNVRVEKNFVGDCSIDEIYAYIEKTTNLTKEQIKDIKNKEIETEIEFAIPREDMLKVFNELKNDNKEIVLISDMYLTEKVIVKMLNKCGYNGWTKLLVSSETGLRKDNGEIWNYYFDEYVKNKSSIHVGDNEHSDIQRLCDMARPFVHVMQGKKIYKLTNYSKFIENEKSIVSLGDKVASGLIINKCIFNSPFVFNQEEFLIKNYHDLGYSIFAPIFVNFFEFLIKETKKNKNDQLLFLAREGHYLEKMYKEYCKFSKEKTINSTYFLTSRRSTSVANIKNMEDVEEIMKSGYEGSLKNLLKTRLGIDVDLKDKNIKLDDCRAEVLEIIKENFKEYSKQFQKEKKNYLKYCSKTIKGKKVAVVDLGYSGTIQYYLMKLLNKKVDGYYFILTDNIKPEKIGGKAYSCYNYKSDDTEKNIYNFSMILEAFLTAPIGQLLYFDEKGKPVHKNEDIEVSFIANLDEISNGIIDFFQDYCPLKEKYNLEITNKFIGSNFSSLVYTDSLSDLIKKDFKLENSYSLDSTINVFDYLRIVYVDNRSK